MNSCIWYKIITIKKKLRLDFLFLKVINKNFSGYCLNAFFILKIENHI